MRASAGSDSVGKAGDPPQPRSATLVPGGSRDSGLPLGNFEDAIVAANQALGLALDSVDARLVLIASLVETGRIEVAKETAREILSIDPGFALARFSASQPYQDDIVLKRLINSVRRAGLREGEDPKLVAEFAQPHSASRRRVAPRPRR